MCPPSLFFPSFISRYKQQLRTGTLIHPVRSRLRFKYTCERNTHTHTHPRTGAWLKVINDSTQYNHTGIGSIKAGEQNQHALSGEESVGCKERAPSEWTGETKWMRQAEGEEERQWM